MGGLFLNSPWNLILVQRLVITFIFPLTPYSLVDGNRGEE